MYCRNCGKELKEGKKFCVYCGAPVSKAAVPRNTGKQPKAEITGAAEPETPAESVTAEAPEEKAKGKRKEKQTKKQKETPKKKGKKRLLIAAVVLLLAVVLVVFADIIYLNKLYLTPVAAPDANEDGHFSVVLSVDQPLLTIGESYDLTFTARVYEDLPGLDEADEISIIDEDGNVLVKQSLTDMENTVENAITEEDGTAENENVETVSTGTAADGRFYTEYALSYTFTPADDEGMVCRAKIAGLESEPLEICAATEITLDMVMTCMEVGDDLEEWLDENAIEAELTDEEILEAVLEWLEDDPRVGEAVINAQNVIYATTDHVGGIYILPGDGTCFGNGSETYEDSGEAETAYRRQEESGSAAAEDGEYLYLDGKNSITNTKILLLNPAKDINDSELQKSYDNYVTMAEKYENIGYQEAEKLDDWAADYKLVSGEICQYGIVNMICHGNFYYNSDGTFTNCYQLTRFTEESQKGIEETLTSCFANKMNIDAPANFGVLYCDPDKPEKCLFFLSDGRQLILSSNGLKLLLQDKFFDNTILYFGTCYGMLGEGLSEFLLSHGAKLVIGWYTTSNCSAERPTYNRVFNDLCKVIKGGATTQVSELTEGFTADFVDGVVSYWNLRHDNWVDLHNLITGNRNDWMEWMPKLWSSDGEYTGMSAQFFYDTPDFRIQGYGTLYGNVEMEQHTITYQADGGIEDEEVIEPAEGVTVTLKRFLNQSFAKSNNEDGKKIETETDEEGNFKFKDLRWAIYGIDLESDEIVDDKAAVTLSDEEFDGETIRVLRYGASVSDVVRVIDRSKIELDDEGNILTDPAELYALSEEPENLNILFILTEAELEEDEDLVGEEYKPEISGDHYYIENLPGGSYTVEIGSEEGTETLYMKLGNGRDYVFDACPEYLITGDLVQTALSLENTSEDYTYEIPEILLSSNEILKLNAEIMDKYGSIAERALNQVWYDIESGGIHYEWWTNQDVLTLYIWNYIYPSMSGYNDPEIICVSISKQKELTRDELLALYRLSEDEFTALCRDAMEKSFNGAAEDDDLARCIAETIEDSNVRAAQPYVGEDGCLWILFTQYWYAGGGDYPHCSSLGVSMESDGTGAF